MDEAELLATARRVLPAGHFGNLEAEIVVASGEGALVRDAAGREYVDFLLGSGPMFLGHAHPEVTAAVIAQIGRGSTFFATNPAGIALAASIVEAVPAAEQVRFFSSGTEADMYAMRLARAFTGRRRILKFEGGYHGMSEYGLMSLAPRRPPNLPTAVPDSAGIPAHLAEDMLVAPFNDTAAALGLIEAHADQIAGVMVEPLQRLIPPRPGFLAALREATARHGIPLIFDEVVTGFRFGYSGAQGLYGVTPDIVTLGKILGGGFPLAAVAGRAEIMAHFDRARVGEERFLMQVGTLSGNPVAAVAGLATLDVLARPGAYDGVLALGAAIMSELAGLVAEAGIPAQVLGHPTVFDVVYAEGEIANHRDLLRQDRSMQAHVNRALRAAGVLKGESKIYLSTAHGPAHADRLLTAFRAALRSLPRAGTASL
ncbi:MAG: aminotransferase class III-fold pyridoxal phosphate-dependent enzyme [Rhodovarius sp.]|nr:aminotransferase class III-fold pyridoxal phosphate-dependent enzyme [Rhodovarius sp.]MDW8313633.1 aminotransferase class III-fold pyridoxal phosphate-dependent enzyme [Rhodovarius sp.]